MTTVPEDWRALVALVPPSSVAWTAAATFPRSGGCSLSAPYIQLGESFPNDRIIAQQRLADLLPACRPPAGDRQIQAVEGVLIRKATLSRVFLPLVAAFSVIDRFGLTAAGAYAAPAKFRLAVLHPPFVCLS